jgi:hypothetical protein
LGHLPALDGLVDALAGKDFALPVDEHDADTGTIREIRSHFNLSANPARGNRAAYLG